MWVVSCKAWQTGFDADAKLRELRGEKKNAKRETWMHFRELWVPKWSEAFRGALHEATGEASFRYSVAVTRLTGKVDQEQAERAWICDPTIASHLAGCEFSFLTMKQPSRLRCFPVPLTDARTWPASGGSRVELVRSRSDA